MKTTILSLLTLVALAGPSLAERDVLNAESGVVHVYIQDENGVAVPNAPVYILDRRKVLTIKNANNLGALSLVLKKGEYVFSSAVTRPIADSIDRYTSHEARVRVAPRDTTTLLLTLRLGDDAISSLSLSTLQKIGVAEEVAQYYN